MKSVEERAICDEERDHADADDLMCEALESCGYADGIEIFRRLDKRCA
jgi:hypothetical protein